MFDSLAVYGPWLIGGVAGLVAFFITASIWGFSCVGVIASDSNDVGGCPKPSSPSNKCRWNRCVQRDRGGSPCMSDGCLSSSQLRLRCGGGLSFE
jgi:hypothetical protein